RLELQGAAGLRLDLTEPVQRSTYRVDGPAEEVVAHRNRQDFAGAADGLPLFDAGELAEHHDTDLPYVEVQRDAERAVLELEQLVGHRRGQPLDPGDAVSGLDHGADFLADRRRGLVRLDEGVQ